MPVLAPATTRRVLPLPRVWARNTSLLVLVLLCLCWPFYAASAGRGIAARSASRIPLKGLGLPESDRFSSPLSSCSVHYLEQKLDQLSRGTSETFKQRYFVCESPKSKRKFKHKDDADRPVLFYCGNEADVTLYLNATGLMWESASKLDDAALVFAEHRYYGKSLPENLLRDDETTLSDKLRFLSVEQALADYAHLIFTLKNGGATSIPGVGPSSPFIAFGGSYGGMLAYWFRLTYPASTVGAIAASAPAFSFLDDKPPYDLESYGATVTDDASPTPGGSCATCASESRVGYSQLLSLADSPEGREQIRQEAKLCKITPLDSIDDVYQLALWVQSSYDFMAMGDFPYPSSYILNGHGTLPPFPVRVACEQLCSDSGSTAIRKLVDSSLVFYNHSGSLDCVDWRVGVNPDTSLDGMLWDYQFCTEMLQPMSRDGKRDMFFSQPFDLNATVSGCMSRWNLTSDRVDPFWAQTRFGGKSALPSVTRVVLSNGELDPWSRGGILPGMVRETGPLGVTPLLIKGAAHHVDLFFSRSDDPPAFTEARARELDIMRAWIADARQKKIVNTAAAAADSKSTSDA